MEGGYVYSPPTNFTASNSRPRPGHVARPHGTEARWPSQRTGLAHGSGLPGQSPSAMRADATASSPGAFSRRRGGRSGKETLFYTVTGHRVHLSPLRHCKQITPKWNVVSHTETLRELNRSHLKIVPTSPTSHTFRLSTPRTQTNHWRRR